ncbi:MAG: hypothetical protein U5K36_04880 [Roseovarius sp.]|nr:hypothetical protein [Roseovarius sp.]
MPKPRNAVWIGASPRSCAREAARERARRAAEATGDVGTHADPAPASRNATLPDPGIQVTHRSLDATVPAPQGRLPDVGETGSARRRPDARRHDRPPMPSHGSRRAQRFRAGFWVALITCALAVGVYLTAPDLVALVPEAEAPIERYVAAINDARLRLDGLVDRAIAQISGS